MRAIVRVYLAGLFRIEGRERMPVRGGVLVQVQGLPGGNIIANEFP